MKFPSRLAALLASFCLPPAGASSYRPLRDRGRDAGGGTGGGGGGGGRGGGGGGGGVGINLDGEYNGDNNRIIGGVESNPGRYPYAVSLSDRHGHFCGASLIARDVALSAAHCQGGPYSVVVGRHDLEGDPSGVGEAVPMREEVPHPDYNDRTTDNDFMLVFLERPVASQYVEFVRLNSDSSNPEVGAPVTVVGWGDTDPSQASALSDVLMEVEVNVISNEECEASEGTTAGWWAYDYQGQITDSMLCAKDGGEDACQGDSGGPLVIRGATTGDGGEGDVQVGVVSWGIGCAHPDFPGVYARLSSAYDWIRGEVCDRSSHAPADFDCAGSGARPTDAPAAPTPTGSPAAATEYPTYFPTSSSSPVEAGPDETPTAAPMRIMPNSTKAPSVATSSAYPTYFPTSSPSSSPTRMTTGLHPTLLPTASPVTSGDVTDEGGGRQTLLLSSEDFRSGYGSFSGEGGTRLLDQAKGRIGVINLQDASTLSSNSIALGGNVTRLDVVFSAYVLRMDPDDRFCLDYDTNGADELTEERCWYDGELPSKEWIDDAGVEFEVPRTTTWARIRFRLEGDSKHDDVLIDAVEVWARYGGNVVEDGAKLPSASPAASVAWRDDDIFVPTFSPTTTPTRYPLTSPTPWPTYNPTAIPTALVRGRVRRHRDPAPPWLRSADDS